MGKFYVYLYTRSHNSHNGPVGSPYYVGKGCGRRAWSRRHHVRPPRNEAHIVIISDGMTEPDALQLEMLLIYRYGRVDRGTGCLVNRTDGGEFTPAFRGNTSGMKGRKHRPESLEKMAAAKLGRKRGPNPPEWNARIAAGNRGNAKSPETRAKISAAKMGQGTGKRPPEWCAAVSRGKMGKARPDMKSGSEHQRKSAATRTGKKRGPYRKRGILDAQEISTRENP